MGKECGKSSNCGGKTVPENYCKAKKQDPSPPCTPCPKRKYKKLKRPTCGSSKVMSKIKPSLQNRDRITRPHALCIMDEEKRRNFIEKQKTRAIIGGLENRCGSGCAVIGYSKQIADGESEEKKDTKGSIVKETRGKCRKQVGQEESDKEGGSICSDISLVDLEVFALTKSEIDSINDNLPRKSKNKKLEDASPNKEDPKKSDKK